MPRITWYGPKFGHNSTGDRVSHTFAVAKALKEKANEIGHQAAWNLDTRPKERTGASQIRTRHYPITDMDSYVYLEDLSQGDSQYAAMGIEMEHHVLQDAVDSV